ncbi:tRNA dihydrouridine synthase DusB [Candidatus Margulisiibacteriota bacterium]
MKIGNLKLKNNVFFAPMAGYSDMPARLFAVEEGCGLVFTEMVHVMGMSRRDKRTLDLLKIHPDEHPIGIQLFGNKPEQFYSATKVAEEFSPEIIDINMGCPMRKVTNGGSGSALMKDPDKAKEIIQNVKKATKLPVTLKFRSGWDKDNLNFIELAKIAEGEGVAALTLHPRTRAQMFKEAADWSQIKKLKESVKIPVIGSGDIKVPEDAKKMLTETNCDAIMIGRAAIGNPWIFGQAIEYIKSGKILPEPDFKERVKLFLKHAKRMTEIKDELRAIREMRKFTPKYLKAEPGVAELRQKINKIEKLVDLEALLLPVLG